MHACTQAERAPLVARHHGPALLVVVLRPYVPGHPRVKDVYELAHQHLQQGGWLQQICLPTARKDEPRVVVTAGQTRKADSGARAMTHLDDGQPLSGCS